MEVALPDFEAVDNVVEVAAVLEDVAVAEVDAEDVLPAVVVGQLEVQVRVEESNRLPLYGIVEPDHIAGWLEHATFDITTTVKCQYVSCATGT